MSESSPSRSLQGKVKKKSGLAKLASKNCVSDLSPIKTSHSTSDLLGDEGSPIEVKNWTNLPSCSSSVSTPSQLNESGLNSHLDNLKMLSDDDDDEEGEVAVETSPQGGVLNTSQSSMKKRVREQAPSSSEDSETDPPLRKTATIQLPDGHQDTISSSVGPSDELHEAYSRVLIDYDGAIGSRGSPNATRRMLRLEQRAGSAMQDVDRALDTISNQSSASASCLNVIPTSDARNKTFLVGSAAGIGGSMLGAAELDRLLPERRVRVFVTTWNMAEPKSNKYPNSLESLLFPNNVEFVPNIYAICIQEGPTDKRELLIRLQATLGPSHVLFEHASHGTLTLCVFLHRDLIWYMSIPEKAFISTRAAVRTKGAVGISFVLFGSSFLFICSHFKADDGNFVQRVEDFERIVATLDLPKLVMNKDASQQTKDITQRFDLIFWAGDLNFRIERPREIVERVMEAIKQPSASSTYEDLLHADELLKARAEGHVFQEFEEGRINFPPTYKYDLFSDDFDTSDKNRVPSYTDRILYKSRRKGAVVCTAYDSIQTLTNSDHRPVFGYFETEIKPGRDNIPLSAGAFNHDIYTEGNRRRALHLDISALNKNANHSKLCIIQ